MSYIDIGTWIHLVFKFIDFTNPKHIKDQKENSSNPTVDPLDLSKPPNLFLESYSTPTKLYPSLDFFPITISHYPNMNIYGLLAEAIQISLLMILFP
jgi:hypothetical protein